jgi:hypothetical protein
MFGRYMYTVADDARRDAQRRRDEALREMAARPDAEPDPVEIVVRRPSPRQSVGRLWRRAHVAVLVLRRRSSRTVQNR